MTDSKDYLDYAWLNDEGLKNYGSVFPDKIAPIKSIVPIMFNSPNLDKPEPGYLIQTNDLTEIQLSILIDIVSNKFNEPNKQLIRNTILNDSIPLRVSQINGVGTKRPYMYFDDDLDEEFNDFDEDFDEDLEAEYDYDNWAEWDPENWDDEEL